MSIPTFLINLKKSPERLESVSSAFQDLNIDFERIEAVDGQELTEDELLEKSAPDFSAYHKKLSNAEFGCYLSHRKCWEIIVKRKLDCAIILEDDIVIQDGFKEFQAQLPDIPIEWDCIKLVEYPLKRQAMYEVDVADWSVCIYDKVPARTAAYVITKSGAEKMLEYSKKISRPVDIDFQYWWEHDTKCLGLKPYPIRLRESKESTIDSEEVRKKASKSIYKKFKQSIEFKLNNKRNTQAWVNKVVQSVGGNRP